MTHRLIDIRPVFFLAIIAAIVLIALMLGEMWSGDYTTTVVLPSVNEYTFNLSKEYLDLVEAMQSGQVENMEQAAGERGVLHSQIADALGVDHDELTEQDIEAVYLEGKSAGYDSE